jgi:hypothetical protein
MFWIMIVLVALACAFVRLGVLIVMTKVLGIALLAAAVALGLMTIAAGTFAWLRRNR